MPEVEETKPEKEKDPEQEMLLSPTWQHRKQEIQFSPFDPEKDESKGRKSGTMQKINLFGVNLLKPNQTEDKRERSSSKSQHRLSIKTTPSKPSPNTTAIATGTQTIKSDRSLDDFEQYVKFK